MKASSLLFAFVASSSVQAQQAGETVATTANNLAVTTAAPAEAAATAPNSLSSQIITGSTDTAAATSTLDPLTGLSVGVVLGQAVVAVVCNMGVCSPAPVAPTATGPTLPAGAQYNNYARETKNAWDIASVVGLAVVLVLL
ncbi:hypothetical protein BDR26DRAFT_856048 [Obelidium mucronatum]|nr:hypothetical protein BDR26DRAFT_856048 [Obelidium mucronatum]